MTKFEKGDWIEFAINGDYIKAVVIRVNRTTYTATTRKLEARGVPSYRVPHRMARLAS
jgi:hypothetical protein